MRNYKQICVHYLLLLFISLNLSVFYSASVNDEPSPSTAFSVASDILTTYDNAGQSRHYQKPTTFNHKDMVVVLCGFMQLVFIWIVICTVYTICKVPSNKQHKSLLHTREPTFTIQANMFS